MEIAPVILEGRHVRLEPLERRHHEGLCRAGLDPSLWEWTTAAVRTPEDMMRYLDAALAERQRGVSMPFATALAATGEVIGCTRYMNVDLGNRRVEIGSTWLAPQHQKTPANTEAKLLMLRHAFETLECLRVELKTDLLNWKSRNAILRLGARQDGIFPNHMTTESGRVRHSVYYSFTAERWPAVKAGLEKALAGGGEPEEWRRVYVLSPDQVDDLMRLFQREWWTARRERNEVVKMLDQSPLNFAYADKETGELVAFARAITDYVYKALILDVIVDIEHRGEGLGALLIDTILKHPEIAAVRHVELYCREDLKPFYKRWGFHETAGAVCFLRRG
jgi:RimJ/RimL family protein N-acetyltransferase